MYRLGWKSLELGSVWCFLRWLNLMCYESTSELSENSDLTPECQPTCFEITGCVWKQLYHFVCQLWQYDLDDVIRVISARTVSSKFTVLAEMLHYKLWQFYTATNNDYFLFSVNSYRMYELFVRKQAKKSPSQFLNGQRWCLVKTGGYSVNNDIKERKAVPIGGARTRMYCVSENNWWLIFCW